MELGLSTLVRLVIHLLIASNLSIQTRVICGNINTGLYEVNGETHLTHDEIEVEIYTRVS